MKPITMLAAVGLGGLSLWALFGSKSAHAKDSTPGKKPVTPGAADAVVIPSQGAVIPSGGAAVVPATTIQTSGGASGLQVDISSGSASIPLPKVPVVIPAALAGQVSPVEPSTGVTNTTTGAATDVLVNQLPKDFQPASQAGGGSGTKLINDLSNVLGGGTTTPAWATERAEWIAAGYGAEWDRLHPNGGAGWTETPLEVFHPELFPAGGDAIKITTPGVHVSADTIQGSAAAAIPGLTDLAGKVIDAMTKGGGAEVPSPQNIDPETVALLSSLLAEEGRAGWKRVHAVGSPLRLWQAKRPATVGSADGKVGPRVAAQLFAETGMAPLVRYWPTTAKNRAAALADYALTVHGIAEKNGTTAAAALVLSREQGQSYATNNPAPVKVVEWQP